jgi:hypothetical protein
MRGSHGRTSYRAPRQPAHPARGVADIPGGERSVLRTVVVREREERTAPKQPLDGLEIWRASMLPAESTAPAPANLGRSK